MRAIVGRMSMRLTTKPWFGPKRGLGWGWTPCSPAGWVTFAVFTAAIVLAVAVWHAPFWVPLVLIAALLLVIVLTGDAPG